MGTASKALKDLQSLASNIRAKGASRFFKTGPGEYGEGDLFLGVTVPDVRKVARTYSDLSIVEMQKLMCSKFHEARLLGFIICTNQFQKNLKVGSTQKNKSLVRAYLKNKKFLNNWDLIDVSAPHILGPYYFSSDRGILKKWIRSKSLWDRRLAILTSFYFIRQHDFSTTVYLCEQSLNDHEDLIHKASGWMLREAGKRDELILIHFLETHSQKMPRTMLRYAIEKLTVAQKRKYLSKASKLSKQS